MTIEITELSPICGAEVRGVELTRPLAPASVERIEQALAQHGVLLFRAQPLSTSPTSVIRPPEMATSARRAGAPVPSITEPFRITTSCAMSLS